MTNNIEKAADVLGKAIDELIEERDVYAMAAERWWRQARQANQDAWSNGKIAMAAMETIDELRDEQDILREALKDAQQLLSAINLADPYTQADFDMTYEHVYEALQTAQQEETCRWEIEEDDEWGVYQTSCGNAFEFTHDGPIENAFKHCPYCGKHIEIVSEEACPMSDSRRPTEDFEKAGRSVLAAQKPWWIKYANCLETELSKLRTERDDEAASCKLWQKRATLFERRAGAAEEMKDRLRNELTQLRAEVEQYKFLLEQAKTLRRDNMILREAIETHRRNVWGEVDSDHDQDVELYKVFDSIPHRSTKAGDDLS